MREKQWEGSQEKRECYKENVQITMQEIKEDHKDWKT